MITKSSIVTVLLIIAVSSFLINFTFGANGIISAHPFDSISDATTSDFSGNNNTAAISGAILSTSGKYGSALLFDGLNDVVSVANIALPTTFTLMAWVRNPTDEEYETIVTVGEYRDLYLGYGVISFYDGATDYAFGNKISNDTWSHVALTYDGVELKAYLNGSIVGSPQPTTLPSVNAKMQMGAWPNGAVNEDYFKGWIDEARVYSRALSVNEIQSDMNTAIVGQTFPSPTSTPALTPISTPIPTSIFPTPSATIVPTVTLVPTATPFSGVRARPENYSLKEGDTVAAYGSDDPDIYIINQAGFKRLFLNPIIFSFYGHLGGFGGVKNISAETRDAFETSGLFRNCETNDSKVYGLETTGEDGGYLHWVNTSGVQAVADDPEFFQKVFCINTQEFNSYPFGLAYISVKQVPVYARK